MKKYSISVIVPVYNAEPFLKRCIDSVLAQTVAIDELILVNDASNDCSLSICEEYKGLYDNIVVLNNEVNRGASFSRNRGLAESTCEYVLFLDSDDYWSDKSMIEVLLSVIDNEPLIDIVLFNRANIDEYGVIHKWPSLPEESYGFGPKESICCLSARGIFPVSTGMKLYRKSFLTSNGISFIEGFVWEDVQFYFNILLNVNKVSIVDKHFYYACYNSSSVSRNVSEKKVRDLYMMIKTCTSMSIRPDRKYALYSMLAYYYCILLAQMNYLHDRTISTNIYKMKWLLKYNAYKPVCILNYISCLFGIKSTKFLLQLYYSFRRLPIVYQKVCPSK